MKIAVDARCITGANRAGISTYLYEIIKYIDKDELKLIYMQPPKENISQSKENVSQRHFYIPTSKPIVQSFWEENILPITINRSKPDLYWGPRFYTPPRLKCPSVATIHDIAFKILPDLIDKRGYDSHSSRIKKALERSNGIITVSKASKQDICEYYNVPDDKVKVIYNGFNNKFAHKLDQTTIHKVLNKFGIHDQFLLFVGTQEPRKNLKNLVKAYAQSRAVKENIPLVIVGKKGWHMIGFEETLNKFINENKVILTGFVSEQELHALYQSCLYFVFPTLYEGFGIPVLEAMSAGAPIITSNNSAMKELFEGYAQLVDPYQTESIQEGLDAMMETSLCEHYRKKGFERIKDFSWEKCAKEHMDVFIDVIEKS